MVWWFFLCFLQLANLIDDAEIFALRSDAESPISYNDIMFASRNTCNNYFKLIILVFLVCWIIVAYLSGGIPNNASDK